MSDWLPLWGTAGRGSTGNCLVPKECDKEQEDYGIVGWQIPLNSPALWNTVGAGKTILPVAEILRVQAPKVLDFIRALDSSFGRF